VSRVWSLSPLSFAGVVGASTPRNNVSSILSELRAASRIEAIDRARSWGYGEDRNRS